MILLEAHNVIIHDVLTDRFERPSRADIQFVDYDNVRFHLSTPESKTVLVLSMAIQCWADLLKYGAREHLANTFGEYLLGEGETEAEYDVSLKIDLERIPQSAEEKAALVSKFAHLKPTAMSSPFLSAFSEQSQLSTTANPEDPNAKGELKIVKYREEEAIYVQASADRVTVIFGTVFKEETDRIYGRLFLQEFVDARKLQSLQSAPQVQYSNREPPLEIRGVPGLKNVLSPRHFANPDLALACINRIQLFRDYLHYHIKCSKAYMHSRMRHRVAEFLKILNRAKPEVAVQERKTATGRTFRSR